jgi:TonB family protein
LRTKIDAVVGDITALSVCSALFALASFAQTTPEPGDDAVRTMIRIDTQHPFHITRDSFPAESIRLGEEGVCKIRIGVAKTGRIESAEIAVSTGYPRLDAACVTAALHELMIPATENGRPVASSAVIPISLILGGSNPEPRLAGISQFEVGSAFYPPAAIEMKQEGECVVRYLVSAQGESSQIEILRSTGFNTLDHACVMAVKHAHFIPAKADRKAITVWTSTTFQWSLPK